MTLFAFIGVVVTSATAIIYGNTIWDPVVLAGKFESKVLVSVAMMVAFNVYALSVQLDAPTMAGHAGAAAVGFPLVVLA